MFLHSSLKFFKNKVIWSFIKLISASNRDDKTNITGTAQKMLTTLFWNLTFACVNFLAAI